MTSLQLANKARQLAIANKPARLYKCIMRYVGESVDVKLLGRAAFLSTEHRSIRICRHSRILRFRYLDIPFGPLVSFLIYALEHSTTASNAIAIFYINSQPCHLLSCTIGKFLV